MSQPIEILSDDDDSIVVRKPKSPAPPIEVVPAPRTPLSTLLEFAGIGLISAVLTAGLVVWKLGPRDSSPSPGAFDSRFVPIGKAYLGDLGVAYAASLEDGAKVLDSGQPISMANDTIAESWTKNKLDAFRKRITPEVSKVVEPGKDEKSVTAADRAALAKAYRGLARGVSNR